MCDGRLNFATTMMFFLASCNVAFTLLISDTACTMCFASALRLWVTPSRCCKHAVVITRAPMNSVVLMARRMVAFVTESDDRPSLDMVLIHAATRKKLLKSLQSIYPLDPSCSAEIL